MFSIVFSVISNSLINIAYLLENKVFIGIALIICAFFSMFLFVYSFSVFLSVLRFFETPNSLRTHSPIGFMLSFMFVGFMFCAACFLIGVSLSFYL